jgi:iron-sulfur cluster assembly protein
MNYAAEKSAKDEEVVAKGVRVLIEPAALMKVVGTTMDWKEDDLSAQFVFSNPNAKSVCGCGESFNT